MARNHKSWASHTICFCVVVEFRAGGREKELQKAVESQRGEREAAERELARAQAQLEQLHSQTTALETRLSQTEAQRQKQAAAVAERTNQIAALQREVEQLQQRLSTLDETLTKEKVSVVLITSILKNYPSLSLGCV